MTKTNSIFLFMMLLLVTSLSAQSIERRVTAAAGKSNLVMSYTVGEALVHTNTVLNVTVGFQQSELAEVAVLSSPDLKDISKTLSVYPNPSVRLVNIQGETLTRDSDVSIYNMNGTRINLPMTFEQDLQLDFDQQLPGIYFLVIQNPKQGTIAKFKILKSK